MIQSFENYSVAIVAALLSSLSFAAASTVQGYAVGRQVGENLEKERMPLSDLRALLRAPRWLAGLLLAGLGSLLNAGGLMLAPVSVVQPIGVLAVPWAVVLETVFNKRKIPTVEWLAVGSALVGTVLFTFLSASNTSPGMRVDQEQLRVFIASLVIYLSAEGLGRLGARGRAKWRSLFWAMGGAFFYGLEAALIRTMRDFVAGPHFYQNLLFWVLAAALIAGSLRGAWMIQQAYATGVAETVVGALTVTNPVVAVIFGVYVLGEGANLTGAAGFGMLVSAALAIGGVILLSQVDAMVKAKQAPAAAAVAPSIEDDADPGERTV